MPTLFNRQRDKQKRNQLRHALPQTEVILWSRLQGKQLNGFRFRRQHGIGRYVADFYCPAVKLVIEIDGDSHFTDQAEKYDEQRNEYMRMLGLKVIRFTNQDIRKNLSTVLETILMACQTSTPPSRSARPPSPSQGEERAL